MPYTGLWALPTWITRACSSWASTRSAQWPPSTIILTTRSMERMGYTKDQDWRVQDLHPRRHPQSTYASPGIVKKKKYGLKVLKFRRRKDLVMPYAHKVFETLNAAYTPSTASLR